jgi:uncharacterized protein YjbJ (UPF0337 family)
VCTLHRPTASLPNTIGQVSKLIPRREEQMMKSSTKDKVEGKLHEVNGGIKEEVEKATSGPNLEVSGKAEKKAGKVQAWIGRVEKAVGE